MRSILLWVALLLVLLAILLTVAGTLAGNMQFYFLAGSLLLAIVSQLSPPP